MKQYLPQATIVARNDTHSSAVGSVRVRQYSDCVGQAGVAMFSRTSCNPEGCGSANHVSCVIGTREGKRMERNAHGKVFAGDLL